MPTTADICLYAGEPRVTDVRLRDLSKCTAPVPPPPPLAPTTPTGWAVPPLRGIGYAPWRWRS